MQDGSIVSGLLDLSFFPFLEIDIRGFYCTFAPYMQILCKIHFVCLHVLTYLYDFSGYADRIYELMAVSRELSLVNEKSSLQRNASRNCIREANYIEFDGVKVSQVCSTIY